MKLAVILSVMNSVNSNNLPRIMFAEDLHEDTPQLTTSGGCQPCNNGFIHVGYDVLNVQIYGTDNNLLTS